MYLFIIVFLFLIFILAWLKIFFSITLELSAHKESWIQHTITEKKCDYLKTEVFITMKMAEGSIKLIKLSHLSD